MERDRDLNQPLQKLLLWLGCRPPDVFKDFVSVEKDTAIEEVDSMEILPASYIGLHRRFRSASRFVSIP